MSIVRKVASAVVTYLVSDKARKFEIALAIGVYEAVRAALGSA